MRAIRKWICFRILSSLGESGSPSSAVLPVLLAILGGNTSEEAGNPRAHTECTTK